MPNRDTTLLRPRLVNLNGLAEVVNEMQQKVGSTTDLWRLLTEHFVVDLDAVSTLVPSEEPEAAWLPARR